MIQLIPCTIPHFNWNAIQSVRQVLGRSLIDTTLNLPDQRRFLVALERLIDRECDDWGTPSPVTLRHFNLSMMVITSRAIILDILQFTRLCYLGAGDDLKDFAVGILSGDLTQWVVAACSGVYIDKPHIKAFAQCIRDNFEKMGLSFVLGD